MVNIKESTAPDGMHDLDLVPFVERSLIVAGTGHYLEVERYGNMRAGDIQFLQHLSDGTGLQILLLTVDDELHIRSGPGGGYCSKQKKL